MGRFLEILGWVVILGAIASAVLMVLTANSYGSGAGGAAGWVALVTVGPFIAFGIVVLIFATIINELKAIRLAVEWQLLIEKDRENAAKAKIDR